MNERVACCPRVPWLAGIVLATGLATLHGDEPPAINPFGRGPAQREDAVPGVVELSDGSSHPGRIYLTRDKRLQIYDAQLKRQREVPLQAVKRIDCAVKREWIEREWRFKEGANDQKVYTGRSYPAREYLHTITLKDGREIVGPLSAIVHVEPPRPAAEPERYLLNKRDKGEIGKGLKAMVYVKRITFDVDPKK